MSSQAFPPENVTLSAGQRKRLFVASCMALMTTAMVFSVRAATLDDLGAQFHVNKQLVGIFAGKAFLGFAAAILIGGLIVKERSWLSRGAKITVTVIVYMTVSWLLQLSLEAVFLPLFDVLKKIGD